MKRTDLLFISLLFACLVGFSDCKVSDVHVSDGILDTLPYNLQLKELLGLHNDNNANSSDHKTLLPLNGSDIAGFILAAVGLLIAAGGGIGGGGILVPIYTLVLNFTPKNAIPLANVSVFGGAVANVLLNLSKRHPDVDRPLVDWDLILMMEPLTIAGAIIGATLNKLLPSWLLVILLVVVLSITAHRTLTKGKRMYEKENEARQLLHPVPIEGKDAAFEATAVSECTTGSGLSRLHLHPDLEMEDDEDILGNTNASSKLPLLQEEVTDEKSLRQSMSQLLLDQNLNNTRLNEVLEEERKTPLLVVVSIIVLFAVVVTVNILKGGGGKFSPLGIKCGSLWFWLAQGFMLLWIGIVAFFARVYLMKRTKLKEEVGYQYIEGDIVWNGRATIVYPLICSVAGLCAGMFGVGGGIVKGPLMLAMGVHPLVASATSATMILFTSLTATTSFVVFGILQYDYAYVMLTIGFVATIIGQTAMNILIKKTGRNSIIVFVIGIVVLVSAIFMVLQAFLTVKKVRAGHGSSTPFCAAGT